MALFGSKRTPLEVLLGSTWASPEERDEAIRQLGTSPPRSGAELVPLLWHADAAVRKLGTRLFVERPDAEGVGKFLDELPGRTPAVKAALLPLLERVPGPLVRGHVDKMLEAKGPEARARGWEVALELPGVVGNTYLERLAREGPPQLRMKALDRLLAATPAARQVELLLRIAAEGDAALKLKALGALAEVDHPRVLERMLDEMADGDAATQKLAEAYLRGAIRRNPEITGALLDSLSRGTDRARRISIQLLLENAEPGALLVEILQRSKGMAGWLRGRILEALSSGGDRILEAALRLAEHQDPQLRTDAIMMLADSFNDRRMVEPFCRLLKDPDWWLRVTACQVLGNLGDERAVPALLASLEDVDARWAAVDALAQIGAPSALQPLAQLLRDPRDEVRLEVLQAFARFSDRRLLPVVKTVRDKDTSAAVRHRAGEVLRDLAERLEPGSAEAAASPAFDAQNLANPLDRLLLRIRQMGASDLHLSVGEPPLVRRDGMLERLEGVGPLSADHSRKFVLSILSEVERAELEAKSALDFCHTVAGVGRYRANAYVQARGLCASFRVIPESPPTFADLGLPEGLKELVDYHQGVILLSGPAGSGKSTTLAALVNLINETKPLHVITLEDPIEFVHQPKLALVNQRQVGRDTAAFATGLRAALREDPDVIVVGELRDPETIRMALEAAETGHLVISTLHTTSAVQTIDRLIESFPPDEQPQVRTAISESLKFILCQRLLPALEPAGRPPGRGRVALYEVLKGTLSIGNKIRKAETFQIPGLMQIGRHLGMKTRDQALAELVEARAIAPETAYRNAEKPASFAAACDPALVAAEELLE